MRADEFESRRESEWRAREKKRVKERRRRVLFYKNGRQREA